MNDIEQAGKNKKSFELNYNGGTIWCEHLDSMGAFEEEVIKKFLEDKKSFTRPSVSSYMIINLDETDITENIVNVSNYICIELRDGLKYRAIGDTVFLEKARSHMDEGTVI